MIGGGVAGLATAKECLEQGLDVTVLEKGPSLGGVWAKAGPGRRAWDGTRSTSSLFNTSFSDLSLAAARRTDRVFFRARRGAGAFLKLSRRGYP